MKSIEESKELIEALEEVGYDTRSYSGRAMYGKSCVAVTDSSPWELARALSLDFDLSCPREDSLGLGNVLYWPSYPWPEDTED